MTIFFYTMTNQSSQDISPESSDDCVASVAFPIAIPGVYDYKIPEQYRTLLTPGTPVLVEVKNRQTWGVVVQTKKKSEFPKLKEILDLKLGKWTDSNKSLIKLYEWIATYYQCDLGRVFRNIVSKGIIKSKQKESIVYSVSETSGEGPLKQNHQDALDRIRVSGKSFTIKEFEHDLFIKPSTITLLFKKGYLVRGTRVVLREATELGMKKIDGRINLTDEQISAVEVISAASQNPEKPFLLYGITGSGKTHVYTELTARTLASGRAVIILVPEISLTPQTIQRFQAAVGDTITVIHSHMSDGERRDSLQELVVGTKRVVIGVRSAILAPMDNVGLIIVDEEHDGSYKQSDLEPRYNARDVAVMRGYFQNALVVLGSATPSMESFQNALSGKYHLVKLNQRFGEACLPKVEIVDMGEEHRQNNWTTLSRYLEARIRETIDKKRQIILLLNRRGYSTVLLCKDCGFIHMCPNCSVSLKYHRDDLTLKCHICGYEAKAPDSCPSCKGEQIKFRGTGIQKAEEMIREKFPDARLLRMDQDTTRRKGAHVTILTAFADGEADILLGTQMVAKGLDFPRVSLVGVLQADTGLHFPDFRASERTFQLLAQVAGRAGRNDSSGEVVIQTYFPEEPAVKSAQVHDFDQFFTREVEHRKELGYPPFGKLARIVIEGPVESAVVSKMNAIANLISRLDSSVTVLGPSPAVLSLINNEYRYSILVKSQSPRKLSDVLFQVRRQHADIPKAMKLIIDVDPVNML